PGDLVLARGQDVAHAADDVATLGRGRAAPALEALARGVDRALHVFSARERPQADEVVLVRGVAVLEELARRGVDPLASDEVAKPFAHDAPPGGGSPPNDDPIVCASRAN